MRFLIMLEQTEAGFAVQAPDLAMPLTERTSKPLSARPVKRFASTSRPIEKPDSSYLKRKAFQTILRTPNFEICCSPTSMYQSLKVE